VWSSVLIVLTPRPTNPNKMVKFLGTDHLQTTALDTPC